MSEFNSTSEMGSHLVPQLKKANQSTTLDSSTKVNSFSAITSQVITDFSLQHPTALMSREKTTDIERQNLNIEAEYADHIELYTRQLEQLYNTQDCLKNHKITAGLRARMIDWMVEVLTNFKCEDQSFFLAVSLMDRFLKGSQVPQEISDLHLIGVTAMFIASKSEDIHPLKMKQVYEKIAHKKLSVERIKQTELDILKVIHYRVPAPTILDFLKIYLK